MRDEFDVCRPPTLRLTRAGSEHTVCVEFGSALPARLDRACVAARQAAREAPFGPRRTSPASVACLPATMRRCASATDRPVFQARSSNSVFLTRFRWPLKALVQHALAVSSHLSSRAALLSSHSPDRHVRVRGPLAQGHGRGEVALRLSPSPRQMRGPRRSLLFQQAPSHNSEWT